MQFNVHARDTEQQVIALSLEAASEADARGMAEGRGLAVFSIEGKRALPAFRSVVRRRTAAFKTSLFSMELLSLLEAGLKLVEALQTLAGKEVAGERQEVVGRLVAFIQRGGPFSRGVAGR